MRVHRYVDIPVRFTSSRLRFRRSSMQFRTVRANELGSVQTLPSQQGSASDMRMQDRWGVVLTLERERLLIDIGPLTDTITTFFNIARAPTRDDIREIGRRLGPAPLRAIFKWADAHADDGNGADISWRHGENTEHLLLQRAEIIRLRDEIDATSEEERVPFTFTGVLTGASIVSKNFDFKPDGSDPIKGRFVDVINENHKVKLPGARYLANVEKVTKVRYSSEEESTTWHLVDLNEIT